MSLPTQPKKQSNAKQISMREHIKKRSMWAGSKACQRIEMYVNRLVPDPYTEEEISIMVHEELRFPPSLYKGIDEIAVNAIDQFVKTGKVTRIDFTCTAEGEISIKNDGPSIPLEKVKNINGVEMYVVQLVFSEFLAGENLDDDENKERIVGGQNGLGAKITAVFSKYFRVETYDEKSGMLYVQVFRDGLSVIEPPVITKVKKPKSYTKITYMPLYSEEFNITNFKKFHNTLEDLLIAKAYHVAAYTGIKVTYNNEVISLRGFSQFCQMFTEMEIMSLPMNQPNKKFPWEVCIGTTENKEQQVSIVNGIFINSGGSHIKHIQNHLIAILKNNIEKLLKKFKVKFNKNLLINNLFIFMKGPIPNPTFASQTKDNITNPISDFKDYAFPESSHIKIWKFVETVVTASFLKKQMGTERTRANRGKIDVPKYREANFCRNAKKSHLCGLIITEGDSATGTAKKGLLSKDTDETFNYDYWGTYSIQGVMVNALKNSIVFGQKIKHNAPASKQRNQKLNKPVRKPTRKDGNDSDSDNESVISTVSEKLEKKTGGTPHKKPKEDFIIKQIITHIPNQKMLENERISSLMKVLGLDFNKTYDFTEQGEKDWKTLRYGFIAGLTDQDLDGFNIFGLLITFFMTYWPYLVRRNFIRRIITPLMRAYPKNRKKEVEEFYTEAEAHEWMRSVGEDVVKNQYSISYYKGLGSHKEAYGEITQMFSDIDDKIRTYALDEKAIPSMEIYYGEETKLRKIALSTPVTEDPHITEIIPVSKQFEIDVKLYQRDNILRKLLSVVDGFIASRRKVFYTARMIGRRVIKVQGFAGECVARADYHHGESSLEKTIVRMAQAYPSARNLPLLQPLGNFGSRDQGYKDAAASRYIYTTINYRLADALFRKEDDYILTYHVEDGNRYEPKYYVPIIPYVLCETNEIPGTGWAMNIHARDIKAIFTNLRALIRGKITKCDTLPYWKKDFEGRIVSYKNRKYFVGAYEYNEKNNTVHITGLPPNKYSYAYIHGIDSKTKKGNTKGIKHKEWVDDYNDETTDDGINITLYLKQGAFEELSSNKSKYGNETFDCFEEYLELKEPMYDRLNLVSSEGEVVEFATYEDVFMEWFRFRRDLYEIRIKRERILIDLEIMMLKEMQRFSREHDDYAITSKTSEEKAIAILHKNKYPVLNKTLIDNPKFTSLQMLFDLITKEEHGANYTYLLGMSYKTLTEDSYSKRQKRIEELLARRKYIETDEDEPFVGSKIWLHELDELEKAINDGINSEWFYGENNYRFKKKGKRSEDNKKGKKNKKDE